MGLLSVSYRRPAYVEKPKSAVRQACLHDDRTSSDSLNKVRSRTSSGFSKGTSGGIPSALSFDKIMDGGTCPPCTIRDFMNYLIYVEHSAENLQFFLWYRDYEKRFADAKTTDLALAPEWTQTMEDEAVARVKKEVSEKMRQAPKGAAEIFKGTDFEKGADPAKGSSVTVTEEPHSQASQAFAAAGVKAPFTIQPFRKELDRVIATYLMDGAPRQLNLSDQEQRAALQALAFTTHPSALRPVARGVVETVLRQQAHPNFIRWSICNGNLARVTLARGLGVGTILLGVVLGVVLALSGARRGYRALAAVVWVVGFATLMAAYKGMCVVLHGLRHRQVRPWELFVSDLDDDKEEDGKAKDSFDSFGTANSYEDEPWVAKYRKRNIIRKVFDREVWIQEPALRQIQDTIFVQSILFAVVCSGILTAVFVAVPKGGFF